MSITTNLRRRLTGASMAAAMALTGGVAATVATPMAAQAAEVQNCDIRNASTNELLARFKVTLYDSSTADTASIQASYYNTDNYRYEPSSWRLFIKEVNGWTPSVAWNGGAWQQQVGTAKRLNISKASVTVRLTHKRTGADVWKSCTSY